VSSNCDPGVDGVRAAAVRLADDAKPRVAAGDREPLDRLRIEAEAASQRELDQIVAASSAALVPSVEPSSTTTTRNGSYVPARIAPTLAAITGSSL